MRGGGFVLRAPGRVTPRGRPRAVTEYRVNTQGDADTSEQVGNTAVQVGRPVVRAGGYTRPSVVAASAYLLAPLLELTTVPAVPRRS